jgi:hypothetical protein
MERYLAPGTSCSRFCDRHAKLRRFRRRGNLRKEYFMDHHIRFSSRRFSLLMISGLFLGFCAQSFAQDYQELPLFQFNGKPIQAWSNLGSMLQDKTSAINDMLSGASSLSTADFDQYFNEIVFPLFTEWKPVKVGGKDTSPIVEGLLGNNTAKMRDRFKRDIAAKATNSAVHEHLNDLTLAKMNEIAMGNFHPVVRANAVMMIAELNDTDPTGPPWKKALPVLLNLVKANNMTDAVRAPAWRGLVRQAQAGVDASNRTQLVDVAVQSLGQRNNVAGGRQVAQDWICRRAIDVLAALNDPAPNPAVSKAILDTVIDAGTSLTIRSAAAEALGKIKFSPPANFDAAALAKTLGKLAVEDYKYELAQDAKHEPMILDRLKQQLGQIRFGLVGADSNGGVHAMTTATDALQYINGLIAPIDSLSAACATPMLDPPGPTTAYGGGMVVIPIDRQKNAADALTNAGSALEASVSRGDPGAPAAAPAAAPGPAPGTPAPEKNEPSDSPLGLN